ncbi:MAG TPA: short chain dehydrogenase [Acidobacteria bacterium]|nr:short chain dehydrogenase [Acidobacteriota bacterium]
MRVIVIGATGIIGRAVVAALAERHEVVSAHRQGDLPVDITSKESIERFYAAAGPFDALVSAAGDGRFGRLESLTDEDFAFSLSSKLMGQVNLVRAGLARVRDGGSFTLTSGLLARYPVVGSAALTLVNAGLEGFARVAALEAPRGVRVNVVSPTWVRETLLAMGRDGSGGLPAATVARAYVESVEGTRTGEVLDVRDFR